MIFEKMSEFEVANGVNGISQRVLTPRRQSSVKTQAPFGASRARNQNPNDVTMTIPFFRKKDPQANTRK